MLCVGRIVLPQTIRTPRSIIPPTHHIVNFHTSAIRNYSLRTLLIWRCSVVIQLSPLCFCCCYWCPCFFGDWQFRLIVIFSFHFANLQKAIRSAPPCFALLVCTAIFLCVKEADFRQKTHTRLGRFGCTTVTPRYTHFFQNIFFPEGKPKKKNRRTICIFFFRPRTIIKHLCSSECETPYFYNSFARTHTNAQRCIARTHRKGTNSSHFSLSSPFFSVFFVNARVTIPRSPSACPAAAAAPLFACPSPYPSSGPSPSSTQRILRKQHRWRRRRHIIRRNRQQHLRHEQPPPLLWRARGPLRI